MKCSRCGAENRGDARFCIHCSAPLTVVQQPNPQPYYGERNGYNYPQGQQQPPPYYPPPAPPAKKDESSVGYAILCFFYPIVGLILYLVWKDERPLRAKSCGKGALTGVILSVLIGVISFIVMMGVAMSAM
ncbi:MAG: zinc ribbon domain-containing protein [Clostridiaceae bacterium]|nr:zinc ribbon domain-containing protein [Clostridiaceae bacterium]